MGSRLPAAPSELAVDTENFDFPISIPSSNRLNEQPAGELCSISRHFNRTAKCPEAVADRPIGYHYDPSVVLMAALANGIKYQIIFKSRLIKVTLK